VKKIGNAYHGLTMYWIVQQKMEKSPTTHTCPLAQTVLGVQRSWELVLKHGQNVTYVSLMNQEHVFGRCIR